MNLQVQRQLQLRIEAQGKYLKKIIEEQQRLSGVLTDGPGAAPAPDNNFPESDNKNDPPTPGPTSEPPFHDKATKEPKSLSVDGSFSSPHEPLTPDSDCPVTSSPVENPIDRAAKKQRTSPDLAFPKSETPLARSLLESNFNPPYQQQHSLFLTGEPFDHPLESGNQMEKSLR